MSDESISGTGPQQEGLAQEASDTSTMSQERLSELISIATASCANIKKSEESATELLKQVSEKLSKAGALSEKINQITPKLAATTTEIETYQASTATHAKQISDVQVRASTIQGELEQILIGVKRQQADIDGLKQTIDTVESSTSQINSEIQKAKTTAESDAAAIKVALDDSTTNAESVKTLADKATSVDQRLKEYEGKLNGLTAQCDEQLEAIKALLPGATSAGLASAFDRRRTTFLGPSKHWQWIFLGSVGALTVLAVWSLVEVYLHDTTISINEIIVTWLSRVPAAAALVWLAMHASREAALAKRLEEDYGFKATVAASFQGFQEQMKNLVDSSIQNEPLKRLCDATLAQITNPPGRIYEKHSLAISPTSELIKAANAGVEIAKAAKLPVVH